MHPDVAESLVNLDLSQELGDLAAPKRILNRRCRLAGRRLARIISSLPHACIISACIGELRDLVVARSYYQKALAIWRQRWAMPIQISPAAHRLVSCPSAGDYASARDNYSQALAISRRHSREASQCRTCLNNLGDLSSEVGILLRHKTTWSIVAIRREALGEMHPELLQPPQLGRLADELGNYALAQDYYSGVSNLAQRSARCIPTSPTLSTI